MCVSQLQQLHQISEKHFNRQTSWTSSVRTPGLNLQVVGPTPQKYFKYTLTRVRPDRSLRGRVQLYKGNRSCSFKLLFFKIKSQQQTGSYWFQLKGQTSSALCENSTSGQCGRQQFYKNPSCPLPPYTCPADRCPHRLHGNQRAASRPHGSGICSVQRSEVSLSTLDRIPSPPRAHTVPVHSSASCFKPTTTIRRVNNNRTNPAIFNL